MIPSNRTSQGSRKFLFIFTALILLLGGGWWVWQKYKYKFVKEKITQTLDEETDRLYSVSYDSLSFDEALGDAYLKNVHIKADTVKVRKMTVDEMPYVMLDIRIGSLRISGVKTAAALAAVNVIGDSVVADRPEIIIYSVKPLNKKTRIEAEARSLYDQILGKLRQIDLDFVFINNARITGIDFFSGEKKYELVNGKIKLDDVLVDSAHNDDPDRVLFCRQAAFLVDSFNTYNNRRKELSVADVSFSGLHKSLQLNHILLNRFNDSAGPSARLLDARKLLITGLNTDSVVKKKFFLIDSIRCSQVDFYPPPADVIKDALPKEPAEPDTTGFMKVYSVSLKHLVFPKVNIDFQNKSNYTLGNLAININNIKANQLLSVREHPLKYSGEAELALSSLAIKSKKKDYDYLFNGIVINSLKKQLRISSFVIKPYAPELRFASNEKYQRDRYDIALKDISLNDILMDDLLDEKIIANELVINKTTAKIYRDLTKPLEQKSKVGNYPSQMLDRLDIPISVNKAVLRNAYIEYKEKQDASDSTGVITFSQSVLNISNITNMPEKVRQNKSMNIAFNTKALGKIPLTGNFKFYLGSKEGKFEVNGHVAPFDPLILNKISIPMALIQVRSGKVNDIDFSLSGNNDRAGGDFVMKYEDLKVAVLKRDKQSNEVKKRGLVSLVANLIVKNDNPKRDDLRKEKPEYERNIYKSFFNLVWKTIFEGMRMTVGLP